MSDHLFRTEEDFLGIKEVPSEAYYGIQTIRALENFNITGYRIHGSIIQGMAIVKKAAALANMEIGILEKEIASAIVWASDEILAGRYIDQFVVDPIQGGAGTSINMNTNEVIANLALEKLGYKKGEYSKVSPNTHVNMSQSTNDAFPTAVHVAIIKTLHDLVTVVRELAESFKDKSIEFDDVIKMGRTHLQDAIPIRLGQEFEAYSKVIFRDLKRIERCTKNLGEVNIGATAVGTGLNADPRYIEKAVNYIREFSGFDNIKLAENLMDATQNTDSYTEISSTLKICMTNLSKIANDLRLMASGPRAGLYEIFLPGRQPGSSIMPGKVNPVMPELINQIAFQVIGNDTTISIASEAGQFELNVMEPVLFFNLIQSITIMTNGLKSFNEFCLKGITANKERLLEYVEKSIGLITAVNPHLGYEKTSKIAREALNSNKTIRELCIQYNYLTPEELNIILDPYEMTKIGIPGLELLKHL